jgi:hypothetical protein
MCLNTGVEAVNIPEKQYDQEARLAVHQKFAEMCLDTAVDIRGHHGTLQQVRRHLQVLRWVQHHCRHPGVCGVIHAGAQRRQEKEDGISVGRIVLAFVDLLVPTLLLSAMAAAFAMAVDCGSFTGQVKLAKILSLVACIAVFLSRAANKVLRIG